MTVTIYHNPRCSKSRQTFELLRENGVEPEIIEYLRTPPSAADLDGLLGKLGMEPRDLMRKNENAYKAAGLDDPSVSRDALLAAMTEHPVLIERPIVVKGDKAVLGRPPENALELI